MKYTVFALSFFSLFVILQNTSCMYSNKYPKETQMLDSMQIFITKADSAVKTIDSAKIASYANNVMKDNQLLTISHVDSVSTEATTIFKNLNTVRWSLLTIAGKRGPLLIELEKSQKQLHHLSHDLKDNLVSADSVKYYVAYETKRASELMQVADMSIDDLNKQLPVYNALKPKADSLISLLENHKKF
jgi:hypothetical protein